MEARLQAEKASMAVAQLHEMREVYEARIEDLKTEHQRTLTALAEQVDFLRAKHYGPPRPASPMIEQFWRDGEDGSDGVDIPLPAPAYVGEEIEDVTSQFESGLLDRTELNDALAQIKRRAGIHTPIHAQLP